MFEGAKQILDVWKLHLECRTGGLHEKVIFKMWGIHRRCVFLNNHLGLLALIFALLLHLSAPAVRAIQPLQSHNEHIDTRLFTGYLLENLFS